MKVFMKKTLESNKRNKLKYFVERWFKFREGENFLAACTRLLTACSM